MQTHIDPTGSPHPKATLGAEAFSKQPYCGTSTVAGSLNAAQNVAHDWQDEVDRLLEGQEIEACSHWRREVEALLMEFDEHGALEG